MLEAWPSHLAQVPPRLFGAFFRVGSRTGPGLIMTPVVALGAAVWWRRGRAFVVCYLVSYLAMVTAAEVPQTRYFVPVLPFISLFAVEGVLTTANWTVAGISRVGAGPRVAGAARAAVISGAVALLAATLAVNGRAIAEVVSARFADDFYRSYQKGEYSDYPALARTLVSNLPPGSVMAREHRVIFAISGAVTCRPFPGYATGRADIPRATTYVLNNGVAAILIDQRHKPSAAAFAEYIERGPLSWRQVGNYEALTLYFCAP